MSVEMIVARARNGVIGGNNQMLWHIPEDFKHFKSTTMGCPILMGRKTWESIGRPLPGRKNVVITRQKGYEALGAECVSSLEEGLALVADEPRVFLLGGGEIYRQGMPLADVLWVTLVDDDFEGDTTFPEIDVQEWSETLLSELKANDKRPYDVRFLRYDRRR